MSTTTISYPETTSGLVLNAGDQEIVSSGGIAYATVISGGTETILSGGSAIGTIESWGTLDVSSGGAASGSIIGGTENIYAGGSEFKAVLSGNQNVYGTATSTTVVLGWQQVYGTAIDTIVDGESTQYVYGTASGTTVNSGGVVFIGYSGTVSDLTVKSGGVVNKIQINGAASDLVLGGSAITDAVFDTNKVEAGGVILAVAVLSGGSTIGTVISGGPNQGIYEYVSSGGSTTGTIVSGGYLEVGSGGVASGTIVNGNDGFVADTGGTIVTFDAVEDDIVASNQPNGAYEAIDAGGLEIGATIANHDYQYVGGTAVSTTLISGYQSVDFQGVASGTVVSGGGIQYVYTGGIATGTTISSGGLASLGRGATATAFTISSGGMEEIASGANVSGTMLLSGGSIYVDYLAYQSNATVSYDQSTHILTLTEDGTSYSQVLSGDYTSDEFKLSAYSSGTLITEVPCYCRNTRIATDRGEIAVEDLEIGDHVINYKGEARSIKWIGKRAYAGRFIQGRKDILPICFEAGSIAENVPHRDLWVSPHHAMYLNGVFIEARDLVNDISIYQADYAEEVEYFHVELDSHDAIIAEGALSESFFNHSDRGVFHNARDYFVLYQNDEKVLEPRYYAPRVDAGETVEAARAVLDARAKTSFRRSFIG